MAKKWKNKLKKQHKAQLIREMMGSSDAPGVSITPTATPQREVAQITKSNTGNKGSVEPAISPTLLPEVERVRNDVKRIGLIVVGLLVILTAVALSDAKTGWILKSANDIFEALKF